jgi:hypothetical protein
VSQQLLSLNVLPHLPIAELLVKPRNPEQPNPLFHQTMTSFSSYLGEKRFDREKDSLFKLQRSAQSNI